MAFETFTEFFTVPFALFLFPIEVLPLSFTESYQTQHIIHDQYWTSLIKLIIFVKKRRFTVLRIFLAFFVIPLIESDQWPTALGNLSFYRLFFFGRFFHLPPSHRDGTAIKAGRIKAPMRGVYLCMSSFVCWRFLFVYFASSLVCVCVCVCVWTPFCPRRCRWRTFMAVGVATKAGATPLCRRACDCTPPPFPYWYRSLIVRHRIKKHPDTVGTTARPAKFFLLRHEPRRSTTLDSRIRLQLSNQKDELDSWTFFSTLITRSFTGNRG